MRHQYRGIIMALSELIELTGLWLKESADGKKFFSGSFGRSRLLIFRNNFKEDENQPDYILYVTKRARREDNGGFEEEADEPTYAEDAPF